MTQSATFRWGLIVFIGALAFATLLPIPKILWPVFSFVLALAVVSSFFERRFIFVTVLCAFIFLGFLRAGGDTLTFPHVSLITSRLEYVRDAFVSHISHTLPEPHASYLAGLLVGGRLVLPYELKRQFQATGTSHLVALSGYNVTIITRYLGGLSRSIWFPIGGIVLFVLATGAASSLVRAAIMGVLAYLAKEYGHDYDVKAALLAAVAVMVFASPNILFHDIGFQLSVAATAGLIFMSPPLEKFFSRVPAKLGIREALVATLAAQLFTFPFILFYFGTFSPLAPLVNVLVIITVPLTMFFGFLVGGIGFLSQGLALIPAWPAYVLLSYQLFIIQFFAHVHVF